MNEDAGERTEPSVDLAGGSEGGTQGRVSDAEWSDDTVGADEPARFRAIGRVEADRLEVTFGAVGMARADEISVRQGAVGIAAGEEIALSQSSARLVLAREAVRLEMGAAASIMANHVDVGKGSAVAVLIARRVEGDVRPLLDWRGAVAFGVAFGAVAGTLGRAGSRRRR